MLKHVENNVFYDLSLSPITFDFVHFLALANMVLTKHNGGTRFNVTIQYDNWRARTRRDTAYSIAEKEWRIYNLLVQICLVTPQVAGITVTQDPGNRSADKPGVWFHSDGTNYLVRALVDATTAYDVDAHLFEAPEVAQKRAEQLLEGIERPVVIPLRVSTFDSDRNTELEVMTTVARDLELSGYTPIFIPDQENMGHFQADQLPGIHIREAAYSLPLRLALHEKAAISICSSSGPTALLALAKKKPTLVVVRPIIETSVDSTEEKFKIQGFDVGNKHPLPWTSDNQIYLWDHSALPDRIHSAVEELCSRAR